MVSNSSRRAITRRLQRAAAYVTGKLSPRNKCWLTWFPHYRCVYVGKGWRTSIWSGGGGGIIVPASLDFHRSCGGPGQNTRPIQPPHTACLRKNVTFMNICILYMYNVQLYVMNTNASRAPSLQVHLPRFSPVYPSIILAFVTQAPGRPARGVSLFFGVD